MPTYEYECTVCGHAFEAFQNINAEALDKCPKCGKKVKRLISSGSGIIFKGSGFYATDYRKKPKSEELKPKTESCPLTKKDCDGCTNKK